MKQKIKYLIWDIDGTLYQAIPQINREFETLNRELLAELFPNDSEEERWRKFTQTRKLCKSATLTFMALGYPNFAKLGEFFENRSPREQYLKPDLRLVSLFKEIKREHQIIHLALRNGATEGTKTIIRLLGLDKLIYPNCELGPFQKIYGAYDQFDTAKPDDKIANFFQLELEAHPEEIAWIGDRIEVDLVPAKKLGMTTILVWQDEVPEEFQKAVDFVLPTVYELSQLLKSESSV